MNEILVRVIAEQAAFLELSGDNVIDPDCAVAQLETIASALQQLSLQERQHFVRTIGRLAEEQRDDRRANFFRGLPVQFGLSR